MHRSALRASLAMLACTGLLALPVSAGVIKEHRSFESRSLEIRNLIGEVRVEGHRGSTFEVDITIQGADSNEGLLKIEESGDTLAIVFPNESRFVYPRMGSGSNTTINSEDGDMGWLSSLLGRGRVKVSGSGSGLEVWADVVIKVPNGGDLVVRHGVGELQAANVEGELDLRIRSGKAAADSIRGNLLIDTGSGHVTVSNVTGDLNIDTGSGHVEASDIEGQRVNIDTGSGHVKLTSARIKDLRIDTGSGRVEAEQISTDSANIDTGSGGVTLQLDRMGTGEFRIDTGSGGIRMILPADAAADFRAETGSGGIDLDIEDGVLMRHMGRDEASFSIGGGGARVVLDTGSGGIRISH